MEQKSIVSERGTVWYWVNRCGDEGARTIIFTHGLTADHSMFGPQEDFFRQNYNLITWDVPLHGLSCPYRSFTYANTAKDLAAILDAEGIKTAVLVGMSMGGYPTQAFVEQFPERVDGFVALDTTPFGTGYYSKFDLWCLRYATAMTRWLPEGMMRSAIINGNAKSQEGRDVLRKILAASTKEQICQQMEAAYGTFANENHDIFIPCPVLIILGEQDKTGKVKTYCDVWAGKTGYPMEIIPDAAHMSNLDNAPAVNRVIQGFLEGCLL